MGGEDNTIQPCTVDYTLVFDSGKHIYFHEHQMSDGFSMTEFYSLLNTWICQSVRSDPHTSLPDLVDVPEGKRNKLGQWLPALLTATLSLLQPLQLRAQSYTP